MASGVPGDDGTPELISMWVSPAGRGRGIGDRLVQAVAQWARQQGAAVLRLTVAEDNEKAAALYQRNGFASTRRAPCQTARRMEMVMEKQLRSAASRSVTAAPGQPSAP